MKFFTLLTCILLGFTFATPGRAEETSGSSPEQQVRTFYAWYLHALDAGVEPIEKKRVELKKYVSTKMLKRIDRLSKREEGLDSDPFLCAQDRDKDWDKHISMSSLRVKGDSAEGKLLLEGKEMGRWELTVQLVREDGAWKISQVEHH